MKHPLILHPFLFAAFPILSLYMINVYEVRAVVMLRPLAVSMVIAALLILLFRPIGKKWRRAALATSLVMVLFHSYGHLYLYLSRNFPRHVFSRADVLMATCAVIMIVGSWVFLRTDKRMIKSTRLLNVASVLLLATIGLNVPKSPQTIVEPIRWKTPPDLAPRPGPMWDGAKPDIYYIILDSYGSEAVLQEFYGVENAAFLDGLRQRGFVIADQSVANYWKTGLSLSSSLNFHYLDDMVAMPAGSNDPRAIEELIAHSAARKFLEEMGYKTITFSTNFDFTDVKDSDVYYEVKPPLSPFEMNLLTGSMALLWVDMSQPVHHRAEIHQHFQDLSASARVSGPKFVFAHLLMPHVPFVFDAEGRAVNPKGNIDGDSYAGGADHYIKGYAGQVQYTNRLIGEAIDAILAESDTPPIIILQGDHGPGAYLKWHSVEGTCFRERFPILNAYYLPGRSGSRVVIPANTTPVNSFRLVFNAYFDTRLSLERNRHYAGTADALYAFTEVTDRLHWCPALDADPGLAEAGK